MTIFRAILPSLYLFCICVFPFQCGQATDQLIEIDDAAGVAEGVFPVKIHVLPTHRADLLDPVGQAAIPLALRIVQKLG